ncbi:MAG TPA: xanthine dehydrogenase molybdopterin binding subunit [Aestuariivirgaceae bacterium]|nr:xanthine dehydrogenase molybdopterin binding subunit [Aestuariivirgaceae bacterium]
MSISVKIQNERAAGLGGPEPRILGQSFPHDDAKAHLRGTASFIDDLREPVGTVHVAPGCADAARGRIQAVDLDAVRRAPEVLAVLTAKDIPAVNDCSPEQGDDPVLAKERVLYHGQPVFAVVAATHEAARRAARLARITLDEEAAVATLAEAARVAGGDIAAPLRLQKGANPEAALAMAALRLDGTLAIAGPEHLYLETQTALAIPDGEGGMRVHSSTQHASHVGRVIARMLGIAEAQVVCQCRRAGGGFGGKQSQAARWAALAALAAHVTGRPAKCRLARSEDLMMTGKGHAARVAWRVGADKGGRILAVDVVMDMACGAAVDLSERVAEGALFHVDNAYFYPELRFELRRLRTDHAPATAFRGNGAQHGMLVAEQLMDAVALSLRLDPLDVRKRNLYRVGRDVTPYGLPLTDNVALALIEELERAADYRARRKAIAQHNYESEFLKKGIALTPVKFGAGFTDSRLNRADVFLAVHGDGSVELRHGASELGQGLNIKLAQIVAEEFGLGLDRIIIKPASSEVLPGAGPTASSMTLDLNGMAARRAAETLKKRLLDHAAAMAGVDPRLPRFGKGAIAAGDQRWSFEELVASAVRARLLLTALGSYALPKVSWDRQRGHGRPFLYFVYGAACSEVTVDTLTGEMRLDRVDILQDCGSSLNPAVDRGQIEGGFVQGLGWLTMEEIVRDQAGRLLTDSLATYKIPLAANLPTDFRVQLLSGRPGRDATGLGTKAVGEPPVMLAISVFSAIAQAIAALKPGAVPALDVPATPEAVMRAVRRIRSGAEA